MAQEGGITVSPTQDRIPLVLIVTGPPATGKTTLARRMAAALALPVMTKDTLKEVLFETLGWSDRAWSQRLSGSSMELLYTFVEAQLAARCSCAVEANFRAEFATPAFRRLTALYRYLPVQVNCSADSAVLAARFRARARSGERHPGHHDCYEQGDPVEGRMEPLDIGGHVIELDTTDLRWVDADRLCDEVRRLWERHVAADVGPDAG